jgi:hypothetical protein
MPDKKNKPPVNAFTYGFKQRMNVLYCPVGVAMATAAAPNAKPKNYQAIWDTGASGSVITRKCARELGLQPTGVVNVRGVSGEELCNTYDVDVCLPNGIRMTNLNVTEGKMTGFDVLIGMDIIGSGDFAVSTNDEGNTFISYRIPTQGKVIDFVTQENKKLERKKEPAKTKQKRRKQERANRKKGRK